MHLANSFQCLMTSLLIQHIEARLFVDPHYCNVTIPQDISLCDDIDDDKNEACSIHKYPKCPEQWTESLVDIVPFTKIIQGIIDVSVRFCCHPCENRKIMKNYTNTIQLFRNVSDGLEQSEFIYPVLGTKSTKHLYSRYFLPILDVPKATLVTIQRNSTVVMGSIIKSCFNLLPLLGICILMALASGVIIWGLDTWYNEEQFPRNFVHGIYEGFWWAFISMTTVGYGDKTPVSICARVFGVLWIVVGITICSMFTASLTAVITNAGLPPTTDIAGKKIIVIEYRLLDASFVLSSGGELYKKLPRDEIEDEASSNDDVYGFMTDFVTAAHFRKRYPYLLKKYDFQDIDFSSSEYTYGVLIKNESVYNFLRPFFDENALFYANCNIEEINEGLKHEKVSTDPFSPENGVFWLSLAVICSICAACFLFGSVFECVRRFRRRKQKGDVLKSDDDLIIQMRDILDEWNKRKKEKSINT